MTEALTALVKKGYTVRRVKAELRLQGYSVELTELELLKRMLQIKNELEAS